MSGVSTKPKNKKNQETQGKEINQVINVDIREQDEKISAALAHTEEIESWHHEANCALQEIMQEQKILLDKLDELESRSKRNNLQVYSIQEEAESKSDSVAQFMDKWLCEKFAINSDLQIQQTHRALAPKPKSGQPPRSTSNSSL